MHSNAEHQVAYLKGDVKRLCTELEVHIDQKNRLRRQVIKLEERIHEQDLLLEDLTYVPEPQSTVVSDPVRWAAYYQQSLQQVAQKQPKLVAYPTEKWFEADPEVWSVGPKRPLKRLAQIELDIKATTVVKSVMNDDEHKRRKFWRSL